MLVGFARCGRDGSFRVLRENRAFLPVMAAGSLLGSLTGASLPGMVPSVLLLPALAIVPVAAACRVRQHR